MSELDAFPLLGELSEADREVLLGYLEQRQLEPERLLYQAGEESDFLALIRAGRLRIEDRDQGIGSFGKGEALGTLSICVIGRRALAARAEEPCELFLLDRPSYHRLRSEAPQIALALQEAILRAFSRSVEEMLEPMAETPEDAA